MPERIGDKRDMPLDEYYERFDGAFVAIVDMINWNRVFLEASARHMALDHEDKGDRFLFPFTEDICPECLAEALLSTVVLPRLEERIEVTSISQPREVVCKR